MGKTVTAHILKADNRMLLFVLDGSGRVTRIDIAWPDDPDTYALPRM